MKSTILTGRAWVIRDSSGKPINDIDTDMIFHNKWLAITKLEEMGLHTFGNLPEWAEFPQKVQQGDILVVGTNFGAGSSRQQAVDCFTALGVSLIIGESFGAIYKRNAINSGLPLMTVSDVMDVLEPIKSGDQLEVNLKTGEIKNLTKNKIISGNPLAKVQLDIYQAGNLFNYGKTL
ncbi:MAG: 3-isopropylmalate dehydratase [Promethearchaeota archaeon]